jgi:hypothetical protein
MAVGSEKILGLLKDLLTSPAEGRGLAADSVIDWLNSFDDHEMAVVSQVLAWLAIIESDADAREAQLHAIAQVAERGQLPLAVLTQVRGISRGSLRGSSVEHYDYLSSM